MSPVIYFAQLRKPDLLSRLSPDRIRIAPTSFKTYSISLYLPVPCSEGALRSSDRLVGSPSRQSVELFQEAHGGFAIWLDPFGMLDPQVVVNLLPAPGVVDERSCRERTKWPSEGLPKGGTHVLAVCVTVQLDDCVALALQQHGERSALRKRKGRG